MAGLFDNLAEIYAEARPSYPKEWFSKLASLTARHAVAWDAGTGGGQAAISLADHYASVIATDVSENQLLQAAQHPRVRYVHTPACMQEDELVLLVGGEGSVDLVTAATAAHYFDLPVFYAAAQRVLRKPGGVVAVWAYWEARVCPEFDAISRRIFLSALPFANPSVRYAMEEYKTLPFPFDGVGLGEEGEPARMEMKKEASFEGMLRLIRSWSPVNAAKERGLDLLTEEVVEELETAWGERSPVREVTFPSFMIAGKPRSHPKDLPVEPSPKSRSID